MALYAHGTFIDDPWQVLAPADAIPGSGALVVDKARFLAEREALLARNAPLGLSLNAGEKLDEILPDLARFELIRLVLPKYNDGRPYSAARLLRDRHGFTGTLRAAGDVLIDQVTFLFRTGFDQLEITHQTTIDRLNNVQHVAVSHFYQPAAQTVPESPAGTRPWQRRPAGGAA